MVKWELLSVDGRFFIKCDKRPQYYFFDDTHEEFLRGFPPRSDQAVEILCHWVSSSNHSYYQIDKYLQETKKLNNKNEKNI